MGMIFDIKRYAIHDGPGIRTTVFLKGCPLNCLWCHNPEGKALEQEFMWWEGRCIGCRSCQSVCARDAMSFTHDTLFIDQGRCDLCGECVNTCPAQALEFVGEELTVAQVMEEVEKDEIFYDESGGGVTLSGGEPLMQADFSKDILKSCRELGFHTTLDTCGYARFDTIRKMCEHVDLVLYDLKVIDEEKHVKFTGVTNKIILENLKRLAVNGSNVVVRFPIVPGVNDEEKDIREVGEFVSSLEYIKGLSVLQYHSAGIEKVKRLISQKDMFSVNNLTSHFTLTEIEERLKSFGLNIQTGA